MKQITGQMPESTKIKGLQKDNNPSFEVNV